MSEKHLVEVDSTDVQCPVTFQPYTEENYPVTLICGHTVSLEAFNSLKKSSPFCPTCRKAIPKKYDVQKNVLWENIAHQIRTSNAVYCENHPEDQAVAVCFADFGFLCADCLIKDEHLKVDGEVVSLKKLKSYLEEKKQTLEENSKRVQESTVTEARVKEIVQEIQNAIEPHIYNIVREELAEHIISEPVDTQELLKRVDHLIRDKLAAGSIEAVWNMREEMEKLDKINPKSDLQKSIDNAFDKVVSKIVPTKGEEVYDLDIKKDLRTLIQPAVQGSYNELKIKFSGKPDGTPPFYLDLKYFAYVQTLHLDFSSCNSISNSRLNELSTALKDMTSLTTLQLDFTLCNSITDAGIQKLSATLEGMVSLTTLHLSFRGCKVGNEGIQVLSQALKRLTCLKNLKLDFGSCSSISDDGMKELSEVLINVESLTSLHLVFSRCELISDIGLIEICKVISKVCGLKEIQLDFSRCKLMTDVGGQELSECISHKLLDDNDLNFAFCAFTDKRLQEMFNCS